VTKTEILKEECMIKITSKEQMDNYQYRCGYVFPTAVNIEMDISVDLPIKAPEITATYLKSPEIVADFKITAKSLRANKISASIIEADIVIAKNIEFIEACCGKILKV
jgi:hypothetical protein